MTTNINNSRIEGWSKECLEEGSNKSGNDKRNFFCNGWTRKERFLSLALSTSLFVVIVLAFVVASLVVIRNHHEHKIEQIQTSYDVGNLPLEEENVAIKPEKFVLFHRNFKNQICLTKGCVKAAAGLMQRMNESVDPCEDFYSFACGTFDHDAVIGDQESSLTPISEISNEQKYKLRIVFEEEISETKDSPSTILAKNLYSSCMDIESINEKGTQPIRDIIDKNLGGWPVLLRSSWNEGNFSWIETMHISRAIGLPVNTIFDLNVYENLANSTQRMLWVDRPPFPVSREYLIMGLNDSVVQAYLKFSIDVAILMGADASQAEEEMKETLQFLMELAEITMSQEDRREVENMFNIKTIREMQTLVPEIPWLDYINRMLPENIKVNENEELNIGDFGYITNITKILEKTSKRVLANYIIWKIIADSVSYLSEDIRVLEFEVTKAISGRSSQSSRWEECVNLVSQSLVHATGNLYIKNYFDEDSKQQIDDLVFYVREAFNEILRTIEWMDPETKNEALIKSRAMKPFIAYAEDLLNDNIITDFYSGLKIEKETQLIHNMLSLSKFDSDYTASLLRKKVNSSDWTERPAAAEVNAFYSFIQNTLEFPAGILQGHFFQRDRPKYMNYGTIGYVIGHEITHGFDDQGRSFDEVGNLRNWWKNSTEQNFLRRAQCIVEQYNNFVSPEIGLNLNGVNTQGENIADNGGVKAAYKAYGLWVRRHGMEDRLPGLDYTPNQLFWISGAQVWCSKYRPESLREFILTDVHSPGRFRIIGPFKNSEDFARDFNCRLGCNMNPMRKCSVW